MKSAIITLEIALETLETNEPIHRAEGNIAQADASAVSAAEIRQALVVLNAIVKARHPIFPEPVVP